MLILPPPRKLGVGFECKWSWLWRRQWLVWSITWRCNTVNLWTKWQLLVDTWRESSQRYSVNETVPTSYPYKLLLNHSTFFVAFKQASCVRQSTLLKKKKKSQAFTLSSWIDLLSLNHWPFIPWNNPSSSRFHSNPFCWRKEDEIFLPCCLICSSRRHCYNWNVSHLCNRIWFGAVRQENC